MKLPRRQFLHLAASAAAQAGKAFPSNIDRRNSMPNIITDYGAVADGGWALDNLTISAGTNTLASATGHWSSADVGKAISVGGAGQSGNPLLTTITGCSDASHITLASNASTGLSKTSHVVCWGTNNARAFRKFTAAYQRAAVTLTVPPGTYYISYGNPLFDGISDLTVMGMGATLAFGIVNLGSHGQYQDNSHSARTRSVQAGSRSVVLTTPSQVSRFAVGRYALMTGLDIQSYGFPSNQHFFEYVLISAIDGNPTSPTYGTITFSAPLKNTYKSTWPFFNGGDSNTPDYGGPATLYILYPQWNCRFYYNGLTIVTDKQVGAPGKDITFANSTFVAPTTGTHGPFPSVNMAWTLDNCRVDSACECDKLVESINILNRSKINALAFQSSSINLLTIGHSTVSLLLGTPKRTVIASSTIGTLRPGAYAYGYSEEIECTNSIISSIELGGHLYKGPSSAGMDAYFTMSNGVITIPPTFLGTALESTRWAVPRSYISWVDADRTSISMFQVLDVTRDANGVHVQTSQSGSFPPYNHEAGDRVLCIRSHPCPKLTFTNCSGTAPAGTNDGSYAYLLSQAPAGRPLYSYLKYVDDGSAVNGPGSHTWGNLVSLKMNVTKPYSGPDGNVAIKPLGSYCWTTRPSDGSLYSYVPSINLKIVGERKVMIASNSQSITGVQSGDSIPSLPEVPLWWANLARGYMVNDIRGEDPSYRPSIMVELITDQGITF
jgi:hypothetical protein